MAIGHYLNHFAKQNTTTLNSQLSTNSAGASLGKDVDMMILSLSDLQSRDFALSKIQIYHQKPTYRELNPNSRKNNGFLYILRGSCHYYHDRGDFALEAGSVVYLPKGSRHRLVIDSESIEFYRIDFTLTVDGEIALFSDHPVKLCTVAPPEAAESFTAMAENYQFVDNTVAKTALLCRAFQVLCDPADTKERKKLAPATAYLLEHLTEKVSCEYLAKLCALSTARFYDLFHTEYGMAPLEYRSKLLIRRAKQLFRDGSFSVSEIADILGFESVSYFSRFFKKHTGRSPAQYKKG